MSDLQWSSAQFSVNDTPDVEKADMVLILDFIVVTSVAQGFKINCF
jgi:hypothetical protein